MKKALLSTAIVLLALSSCTTMKKTATSIDVANSISTNTTADLDVSDKRISYTLRPTKQERKGGTDNIRNTAVAAALKSNGGGDVLVAPEFETKISRNLFGTRKIKEITVTGYPAKYKNFQSKK